MTLELFLSCLISLVATTAICYVSTLVTRWSFLFEHIYFYFLFVWLAHFNSSVRHWYTMFKSVCNVLTSTCVWHIPIRKTVYSEMNAQIPKVSGSNLFWHVKRNNRMLQTPRKNLLSSDYTTALHRSRHKNISFWRVDIEFSLTKVKRSMHPDPLG